MRYVGTWQHIESKYERLDFIDLIFRFYCTGKIKNGIKFEHSSHLFSFIRIALLVKLKLNRR